MLHCISCESSFRPGNFNGGRARFCRYCRTAAKCVRARIQRRGEAVTWSADQVTEVLQEMARRRRLSTTTPSAAPDPSAGTSSPG